ncbi:MAG: type II secretion system protein [Planctomycetota bacterium]|jgi:prepilin-type N-terminal cleavage/methylation domain-containing protein
MSKSKGLTLIELLVVISITALLMSILLPALSRTRKQAKSVLCKSNLRQLGFAFSMYTNDNSGSFNSGRGVEQWFEALKPYYQDSNEVLLCPMANDPAKYPWEGEGTFGTWGPEWFDGTYGSYGINEWITNPPRGSPFFNYKRENNWRNANAGSASQIPMLADAWWPEGWAEHYDTVPEYSGQWETVTYDDIGHFCIDRHDGFVNGVFVDYSVSKIGLKQLWKLKWHRNFDVSAGPTTAEFNSAGNGWMIPFKDY